MKKTLFIFLFSLSTAISFCAANVIKEGTELLTDEVPSFPSQDEVEAMDSLISIMEKRIAEQKELKVLMAQFKEQKETFIKSNQTKQHASVMVNTARKILSIIGEQRLQYLFSSDFLEELAFFSSIAGKSAPTRP